MKIPNKRPPWAKYFLTQHDERFFCWMGENKMQACYKDGNPRTDAPSYIDKEEFEEYLAGMYGWVCYKLKMNMENK